MVPPFLLQFPTMCPMCLVATSLVQLTTLIRTNPWRLLLVPPTPSIVRVAALELVKELRTTLVLPATVRIMSLTSVIDPGQLNAPGDLGKTPPSARALPIAKNVPLVYTAGIRLFMARPLLNNNAGILLLRFKILNLLLPTPPTILSGKHRISHRPRPSLSPPPETPTQFPL